MAKQEFDGQILHFGAVRYRLTGSGTFKSTLTSLDDVNTTNLPDIAMTATANRLPTILANFNEQRAYLEGKVEVLNERFVISQIIIYIRPVATGYPNV